MKLYVKNMVCPRCIAAVRQTFVDMGIQPTQVDLGEVEAPAELTAEQKSELSERLTAQGFELLEENGLRQVEAIKHLIIDLIYKHDAQLSSSLSDYLSSALGRDYKSIATQFREVHGQTVERYFISQKIERVKELMMYDELSLSEIAYRLNYSSVAHLSAQFKRETGCSPSVYKAGTPHRRPIDGI